MTIEGAGIVKEHPQYYIREGNVCFLVEDTIFRLHKYFFDRESTFFQVLFSQPRDGDGTKPPPQYKLDVTVDEFSTLCWLWYNPKYNYARQGKDTWLTLLHLATKWDFPEVKRLSIGQLQRVKLEPVERIELYKKYKVDEKLLVPSYMALCKSPTLPSLPDAAKLTMDTFLRIATAREKALLSAAASGCATPTSASAPDDVLEQIIGELFDLAPHSNDKTVGGEGQVVNSHEDVITVRDPVNKKSEKGQVQGPNGRQNASGTATNGVKGNST